MAAPSFSSFPPSFNSFPDLDSEPGPSKSAQREGRSRDNKERKDKHKRRRKSREGSQHKHRGSEEDRIFKEDEVQQDRLRDTEFLGGRPLYYSDRKGDILNIKYGGLYSGDIPRYHLVAREQPLMCYNNY